MSVEDVNYQIGLGITELSHAFDSELEPTLVAQAAAVAPMPKAFEDRLNQLVNQQNDILPQAVERSNQIMEQVEKAAPLFTEATAGSSRGNDLNAAIAAAFRQAGELQDKTRVLPELTTEAINAVRLAMNAVQKLSDAHRQAAEAGH